MSQWIDACGKNDIDEEDVMRFDHAGKTYAIYRSPDDKFYATDGLCTHEHPEGGPQPRARRRPGRRSRRAGARRRVRVAPRLVMMRRLLLPREERCFGARAIEPKNARKSRSAANGASRHLSRRVSWAMLRADLTFMSPGRPTPDHERH